MKNIMNKYTDNTRFAIESNSVNNYIVQTIQIKISGNLLNLKIQINSMENKINYKMLFLNSIMLHNFTVPFNSLA
jgi:hypothetical protein